MTSRGVSDFFAADAGSIGSVYRNQNFVHSGTKLSFAHKIYEANLIRIMEPISTSDPPIKKYILGIVLKRIKLKRTTKNG